MAFRSLASVAVASCNSGRIYRSHVGRWCLVDNEAMASGKDSRPFLDERGRRLFIRNAPPRVTKLSAQSSVVTTRNHFREPRFWGGIRRLRSRVRTGHVEFVVPLTGDR